MHHIRCVRTSLDIDDDVLSAAKELAASRNTAAGRVISYLARQALTRSLEADKLPTRNGFPVLPRTGKVITSNSSTISWKMTSNRVRALLDINLLIASFDRAIPVAAVRSAEPQHLVVI
jgi:hypothetical protein